MELVKNIFFNTDKIVEGATVKISYVGYLFQNGSNDVYLHYGYGENWNNIGEIKTEKTELGYQTEITIPYGYKTLNLCYKNGSGEWDNNNGNNYIFDIEPCAQNIEDIEIDTTSKINDETITNTGVATEINSGVNVGSYYSSVGTDSSPANTYNVYDIYGTSADKTDVTTDTVGSSDVNINTNTYNTDITVNPTTTASTTPVSTVSTSETSNSTLNNYLTVTEETGIQMHKGLRKTYIWSKKIKLAIYKIIKYVPKIISGNYKRKVNE